MVIGQLATALALVVSAGFLIKSFMAIHRIDPGFNTDHVLTMRLTLPSFLFEDDSRRAQDEVQKVTDAHTSQIDELTGNKEKELIEI